MDGSGVGWAEQQRLCAVLAKEYPFAAKLRSNARQASADRAWAAVSRFYQNCREHKPEKKSYPRFQKDNRSVEYKVGGWKLDADGKHLTFTDGTGIGTVRLVGTRSIEIFPIKQIKRVRLVKRADGSYVQFAVQAERKIAYKPTGRRLGIDVGLKTYCTDSEGNTVANPRHLPKAEKQLKRLHRRVSRTIKRSKNRKKAIKRLAKGYLKVSRQRKDFAALAASALVKFSGLIVYEDLKVANLVKNHHLARSISDAGWYGFLCWVRYYAGLHGIPEVAVSRRFTTQGCSGCGYRVKETLSMRTHVCPRCGLVLDRDQNAALNILEFALRTAGQAGTGSGSPGHNASGQRSHCLTPAIASGKLAG